MKGQSFGIAVVCWALWGSISLAAEGVRKIQDNSFLLEEAYNQEDGVVQHIQTFQRMMGGDWGYSFTQEWPVPTQKNQFSYTIPYLRLDGDAGATGLGDVLLNYRYQALLEGPVAFAPRVSLILPTGNPEKGLGSGAWGVQGNLPLSVELGDRWVTHWNLGATFIPGAEGPDGSHADITGFNYGASLIYCVDDHLNLMLEAVGNTNETVTHGGRTETEHSFFLNPGLRYAIDVDSGLQIVPGLSFPIGIGPSAGEWGVFFYLSFEHPLFEPKGS
jgi:hypothetical protein